MLTSRHARTTSVSPRTWPRLIGGLAALLLFVGCATPPAPGTPVARDTTPPPRVLTIAVGREPSMLNPDLTPGLVGGNGVANVALIVHETLVVQNERYDWVPQLAVEPLSSERGTWQINPDGTMRTTWRLRPNVRWHDDTPFTAADLVFAYHTYRDPTVPNRARPALELITAASAPDPTTLVLEWAAPYAYADRAEGLIPLPHHLLADVDPRELIESRFFTTRFVGLGPYRLVTWEPGSYFELGRFDGYYRGLPFYDTVIVRIVPDQSAVVAAFLAGAVDVIPGGVLGIEPAVALRDQRPGAAYEISFATTPSFRQIDVQHHPDFARPANATTHPLVRRALYHAIDRTAIVESVFGGVAPIADSLVPPTHPLRAQLEASIPAYPYDPAHARRLFSEAGWSPTGDGTLGQVTGARLDLDMRVNPGAEGQQVQSIVGHYWQAVGVSVELTVLTPAQASDREYRAKLPGAIVFNHPAERYYVRQDLHTRNMPSAEDRWAGGNRANYRNARLDQLLEQLQVRIVPGERVQLLRDVNREVMDDVALLPLHWVVEPIATQATIKGMRGSMAWNVFDWHAVGSP